MAEAFPNDINIHMPIRNPSSKGTRYTHALSSNLHISFNMGNSSSTPKISAQDRLATMFLSAAATTLLTLTQGPSLT
jgi:hypothetical protein